MMRKYLIVVIVIVVGAIAWYATNPKTAPVALAPTESADSQAQTAQVEIRLPDAEPLKQSVAVQEGNNALVVTEKIAAVEKQGEGMNAFVTSLNGVAADQAKRQFWALYVNDKQSEVGAGTYQVQPGDVIRWQLETY